MISIVIPALNEEQNLRASVLTILGAAKAAGDVPLDIMIINDGSTDRTAEVCAELEKEFSCVRAFHHPVNTGQGSCILDGIRLAKYDLLNMFPGDNAVASYTLRSLFNNRDKADYVLAMILNTEYRSKARVVLSAIFHHIYTLTFDLPIKYINAPALWPVPLLRKMNLRAQRYSLFGEINVKLLRQPITFFEVEGYMNPSIQKSSAIRIKNLLEVILSFLRLWADVFIFKRSEYAARAKRAIPPGAFDR